MKKPLTLALSTLAALAIVLSVAGIATAQQSGSVQPDKQVVAALTPPATARSPQSLMPGTKIPGIKLAQNCYDSDGRLCAFPDGCFDRYGRYRCSCNECARCLRICQ